MTEYITHSCANVKISDIKFAHKHSKRTRAQSILIQYQVQCRTKLGCISKYQSQKVPHTWFIVALSLLKTCTVGSECDLYLMGI